jgi:hypothetical protein
MLAAPIPLAIAPRRDSPSFACTGIEVLAAPIPLAIAPRRDSPSFACTGIEMLAAPIPRAIAPRLAELRVRRRRVSDSARRILAIAPRRDAHVGEGPLACAWEPVLVADDLPGAPPPPTLEPPTRPLQAREPYPRELRVGRDCLRLLSCSSVRRRFLERSLSIARARSRALFVAFSMTGFSSDTSSLTHVSVAARRDCEAEALSIARVRSHALFCSSRPRFVVSTRAVAPLAGRSTCSASSRRLTNRDARAESREAPQAQRRGEHRYARQ